MADLSTKTFAQLVQDQAAAIQARSAGLIDFSVGAIVRAVTEAVSAVVLWLQGLILAVLAASRAATSSGSDLDSWIADFGAAPSAQDATIFARLGASRATGTATFSRFSTSGQSVIPVGAVISTADGAQQFAVVLDTGNAAYRAPLGGYLMDVGVSILALSVLAVTAGAAGNAVAGVVNTISSAITGVDTVTNAAAFSGGQDAETDDALRARFRGYLQSLREATPAALGFWIASLQAGVSYKLVEGELYDGTARRGFFYFVVDDGSGSPPASLITAAGAAIDAHRAAGIEFATYAPVVVPVDATIALSVVSGADAAATRSAVQTAVAAFISSLPLAQPVFLSRIYQVAHDASGNLAEITALTLNGSAADVAITKRQVAKARTITVTS